MTPDGIKRLMLDEGLHLKLDDSWGVSPPVIGFGRKLVAQGISFDEARSLLDNDLNAITHKLLKLHPWIAGIPAVWADILMMIEYNVDSVLGRANLVHAMRNGNTDVALNYLEFISNRMRLGNRMRYERFGEALLYRRWLFSDIEEAAYQKMIASS